jgi:hypothetical protein
VLKFHFIVVLYGPMCLVSGCVWFYNNELNELYIVYIFVFSAIAVRILGYHTLLSSFDDLIKSLARTESIFKDLQISMFPNVWSIVRVSIFHSLFSRLSLNFYFICYKFNSMPYYEHVSLNYRGKNTWMCSCLFVKVDNLYIDKHWVRRIIG